MNYGDHYQRKNNHKVIGLIKDELYGKIMTELAASRPKAYSYLTDDSDKNKKAKKKKAQKDVSWNENLNLNIIDII